MTSSSECVLVEDHEAVRRITLNRPDVLNSFNTELLTTLGKAMRDAEKDKAVRCVVVTGAGRGFCAGQDLAEVRGRYDSDAPLELGAQLRKLYNPLIAKMRTMEKPIIGSINGVAAGAGFSLALACDMRIAAESASFVQAFVHVGVVPDSGSTLFLPRLIGPARAFELAATGRKVKSDEALRLGLVNQVVADGELQEVTRALAQKLASLPTKSIGLTKRAMNAGWSNELEAQLDYEAQLQTTAGRTQDHREGVMAFLEKRSPKFAGE